MLNLFPPSRICHITPPAIAARPRCVCLIVPSRVIARLPLNLSHLSHICLVVQPGTAPFTPPAPPASPPHPRRPRHPRRSPHLPPHADPVWVGPAARAPGPYPRS
jgi:hypothetical protein